MLPAPLQFKGGIILSGGGEHLIDSLSQWHPVILVPSRGILGRGDLRVRLAFRLVRSRRGRPRNVRRLRASGTSTSNRIVTRG